MQLNEEPGFITVHLATDGWFWMIPLPGEIMSVGFVGNAEVFKQRRGTAQELYLDRLQRSPTVAARMVGRSAWGRSPQPATTRTAPPPATARAGWPSATRSPSSIRCSASGVLLAMTAAGFGADVAQASLASPAAGRALAQRAERQMCQAMDNLGWLVYRINTPVLRSMFMMPSNRFRMRDGLVAMLAGNLRIGWSLRGPVLAFKAAYYMLTILRRVGWKPDLPAPTGQMVGGRVGPPPRPHQTRTTPRSASSAPRSARPNCRRCAP